MGAQQGDESHRHSFFKKSVSLADSGSSDPFCRISLHFARVTAAFVGAGRSASGRVAGTGGAGRGSGERGSGWGRARLAVVGAVVAETAEAGSVAMAGTDASAAAAGGVDGVVAIVGAGSAAVTGSGTTGAG
jgi:hydrogenase maturation factor HypF (carbamoyltransferase family)